MNCVVVGKLYITPDCLSLFEKRGYVMPKPYLSDCWWHKQVQYIWWKLSQGRLSRWREEGLVGGEGITKCRCLGSFCKIGVDVLDFCWVKF